MAAFATIPSHAPIFNSRSPFASLAKAALARLNAVDLLTLTFWTGFANFLRYSYLGDHATSGLFCLVASLSLGLRMVLNRIEAKIDRMG